MFFVKFVTDGFFEGEGQPGAGPGPSVRHGRCAHCERGDMIGAYRIICLVWCLVDRERGDVIGAHGVIDMS